MRRTVKLALLTLLTLAAVTGLGPVFSQDPAEAPGQPGQPQWLDSAAGSGGDPADPLTGKYSRLAWTPPTTGTPVAHYLVQMVEMGGATADTTTCADVIESFKDVFVNFGYMYKARVAGIDAESRQGPWSLWTPFYGPELSPDDMGDR